LHFFWIGSATLLLAGVYNTTENVTANYIWKEEVLNLCVALIDVALVSTTPSVPDVDKYGYCPAAVSFALLSGVVFIGLVLKLICCSL
jgi:hypothetical protein